jgi:hypothetical protein
MLTEPPSDQESPVPCRWCSLPIVFTEAGWTHLDQYHRLAGWLCPLPHMHLAEPQEQQAARSQPKHTGPVHASEAPADQLKPRRRPTSIPPRKNPTEAPTEWPPSEGNPMWWEVR